MKRRILVLLFAALCITALLSSCADVNCVHTDADKNNVCDSCSMPVVTITEYVTAEEEVVETVVKPMPGNIKFSEYLIPETLNIIKGTYTVAENIDRNTQNRNGLYIVTYSEQSEDESYVTDFVKVYDANNDKVVYSFNSGEYSKGETNRDSATVRFENSYIFRVALTEYDEELFTLKTSYEYYTFSGEKISTLEEEKSFSYNREYDGLIYYSQDGFVYAIDTETYKVVYKDETDTFVYRPGFTEMSDTVGVVVSGNMIYAYDLTKWIECVYSYRIPSYYSKVSTFCLADGKVLVQCERPTTTDAVNYDFLTETVVSSSLTQVDKYFIDYILVDTVAKTATEEEFGYYIKSAAPIETDAIKVAGAKNRFEIYRIENKLRSTVLEEVIVDGNLNIVANITENNPVMVNAVTYLAPGFYMGHVVYGDGSSVYAVFNDDGKQVAVLPSSYSEYANMLCIENKLYTWDMKEKLDLDDYMIYYIGENYLILSKNAEEEIRTEYFFYNDSVEAPVRIIEDSDTATIDGTTYNYFVIRDTSDPEKTVYNYYNILGEKIFTSEMRVNSIGSFGDAWKVIFSDGTVAFIR